MIEPGSGYVIFGSPQAVLLPYGGRRNAAPESERMPGAYAKSIYSQLGHPRCPPKASRHLYYWQ